MERQSLHAEALNVNSHNHRQNEALLPKLAIPFLAKLLHAVMHDLILHLAKIQRKIFAYLRKGAAAHYQVVCTALSVHGSAFLSTGPFVQLPV